MKRSSYPSERFAEAFSKYRSASKDSRDLWARCGARIMGFPLKMKVVGVFSRDSQVSLHHGGRSDE